MPRAIAHYMLSNPRFSKAHKRWFYWVGVTAPGTEFGGWSFACADEHSAKLAVDAINYAAGSDAIAYSRKAFSEEGM